MKTKAHRLFIGIVALFLLSSILCISIGASTYIGDADDTEGILMWKKYYRYKLYNDTQLMRVFQNHKLSRIASHTQFSNAPQYVDFTLSVTDEQTITYSTTWDYNVSLGLDAGIKDVVSVSASKGWGLATGVSFSTSRATTYTKYIYSNYPTGYYFLAPAQEEYHCHWDRQMKNTNGVYVDLDEHGNYVMPVGTTFIAAFYSTASDGSSGYYVSS